MNFPHVKYENDLLHRYSSENGKLRCSCFSYISMPVVLVGAGRQGRASLCTAQPCWTSFNTSEKLLVQNFVKVMCVSKFGGGVRCCI